MMKIKLISFILLTFISVSLNAVENRDKKNPSTPPNTPLSSFPLSKKKLIPFGGIVNDAEAFDSFSQFANPQPLQPIVEETKTVPLAKKEEVSASSSSST